MSSSDWRPAASLETLRARAALLAAIRGFFAARGVLEVETPLLCRACGSDPNLEALMAESRYLQTSPEFAMKRLLAAGSGPIFQLGRAFRQGERGRRHNPEFTMLEWYRPGFDDGRLMDEVAALLQAAAGIETPARLSYRALFLEHLDIDPHAAAEAELEALARARLDLRVEGAGKDLWLDLLFSHLVEPALRAPVFVFDFPASQAALARIETDEQGVPVARRFELIMAGMEIANGYYELSDPREQRARFEADLRLREARGQPRPPLDEALLAALAHGLPDCAGVALGVDRLLMCLVAAQAIDEVLAFPWERA